MRASFLVFALAITQANVSLADVVFPPLKVLECQATRLCELGQNCIDVSRAGTIAIIGPDDPSLKSDARHFANFSSTSDAIGREYLTAYQYMFRERVKLSDPDIQSLQFSWIIEVGMNGDFVVVDREQRLIVKCDQNSKFN
ncbi:hypothetical protein [Ruegeria lacuscaerulensis]|uniref:hypothetical protein n=1 Tax=Ruegeria lacuscaerulensis TaxID=55218 RepID=UPI00147F7C5F|nr:hypothetical protein [Ruegeria lacuscaerulensis]